MPDLPPDAAVRPTTPGALVRVRYTKWDGSPHWEYDGLWLGTDEHGDWVGFPAGTHYERPGWAFDSTWHTVGLFPAAGWTPAFNHEHPKGTRTYVDLTTVPEWRADAPAPTITMVDLDLDVIEPAARPVYVDDEDEFAEHETRFGYPPELVARVRADADAVLAAVVRREAPFDGPTAERWLARLAALVG
ncbi:DUF402 domain-containing protein [Agromyces sp. MMS24-K17]|uniref:DUF402 domain-containing protein n=1 Tax=Agromyces sp. MMS24-K17 TaxID=3372850 RepID=UPI003754BB13